MMSRMKISNLPTELVEEILWRVPYASVQAVRSTCKKWDVLFKDKSFAKKHIAKVNEREFRIFKVEDSDVQFFDFNPSEILNKNFDLSINRKERKHDRLIVWNPYCGELRCIEFKPKKMEAWMSVDTFALGYDKSCSSYKILRFCDNEFRIYDLSSDSWRVLDITPDKDIKYGNFKVSLKGNAYCVVVAKKSTYRLLRFDFTAERFGPCIPMPYDDIHSDSKICLSTVREEKLALLLGRCCAAELEIWVTNKIETDDAVSWNKFLYVHNPGICCCSAFVIEEEKNVAAVSYDVSVDETGHHRSTAYIIGGKVYKQKK